MGASRRTFLYGILAAGFLTFDIAAADDDSLVAALSKLGGKVERDATDGNSIVKVDLAGTKANDITLKLLVGLPKLKSLDLQETQITNVGLKTLAKFPELREVRIAGTKLSDVAIRDLQKAAPDLQIDRNLGIERLQPRFDALQGNGIKLGTRIDQTTGKVSVELEAAFPCTDAQLQTVIEKLPELTRVMISSSRNIPSQNVLPMLRRLPKLESLSLIMPVNDAGVSVLYGMASLRRLYITSDNRSNSAQAGLIPGPMLSDAAIVNAKGWSNLEFIHISEIAVLGRARDGSFIMGSAFTDRALLALSKFPKLNSIELDGSQVTDAGLQALVGMKQLTDLNLGNCKNITDGAIAPLSKMTNLTRLSLTLTSMTPQGTVALKQALPNTKILGN